MTINSSVDDGRRAQLHPVSPIAELTRFGTTTAHAAAGLGRFVLHTAGDALRGRAPSAARAAHEIRDTFERLGPTYVKLGQLIASSPGVFSETLSSEFETLLDRVKPADPELIREQFTRELGRTPEEVFAEFDPEPIASASIAQVHTATLHSGEEVVVKIQRPGIADRLSPDVAILERLAGLVELSEYGRMLSARHVVEDFAAGLDAELDFRIEADTMREWFECLQPGPFGDRVRVPQVYDELTTQRVLTMERIRAIRIDDARAVRKAGHDGVALCRNLLLSLLDSAFHGGLFHGDLHAGNVLVDDEGKLVLLDFGIVGRFTPRTRRILRQLVVDLLVRGDYEAAGRAIFLLGAVRKPGSTAKGAEDIKKVTNPLASTDLGSMSYTDLGRQLAAVARAHDARLPRELVLVGKQLLYVEKYMKLLAPRWKAMSDREIYAYMAGIMKEAERDRRSEKAQLNR
ncbi:ABC1 kinase family protein [Gordonia paraffinivorans]|uniref:Aminoglycoside acetyltransferase regulator n=1 Tax=Gordonia paraffinivorans TaxID=175628 RepID=A0ABD7V482_9ACTN|nr:AarF/UbiB family protein [Gordonia paraffinivorans]MCD2146001.1 AarF/UbiB family protein [Gordonia paraffinivorans]VFA89163.1 Aminoglycoside acetyltransferase regulator [Gordonia paraffinivorans]